MHLKSVPAEYLHRDLLHNLLDNGAPFSAPVRREGIVRVTVERRFNKDPDLRSRYANCNFQLRIATLAIHAVKHSVSQSVILCDIIFILFII